LGGGQEQVQVVALSPDGRVVTGSSDGTVRFYVLPLDELETVARMRLTRSLTATECREFLHLDQRPADQLKTPRTTSNANIVTFFVTPPRRSLAMLFTTMLVKGEPELDQPKLSVKRRLARRRSQPSGSLRCSNKLWVNL
jgi:hypothetical protein